MDRGRFEALLDDESRKLVDDKVRECVDRCSTGNAYGAMFDRKGVEDVVRSLVEENLALKNDLVSVRGMLARAYAIMEKITQNPEFARIMEDGRKDGQE